MDIPDKWINNFVNEFLQELEIQYNNDFEFKKKAYKNFKKDLKNILLEEVIMGLNPQDSVEHFLFLIKFGNRYPTEQLN